ncbi:MAG: 3-hydroxybutyryl-CoA dehydrogenase, partial [Ignavibacteria bacterium]|nr:3-hydroxybutyryl-CoA dehydrogenase [Ignavibacteria bacterium]
NFPEYEKTEELQYIEANSAKNVPIFTSSLCSSVSAQSALQENPERLIGIGLYDTFSKAKRIEIAPSKITDDAILKNAENFLSEAGINYSIVPDRVGLIFPRIVSMIINEAVQVFSELIASKEDIDTAMKLGTNYPFGPLEWADRLGIELVCNILAGLQRDFGEDRYRPHPLLKEMIDLKKSFY